MKGTERQAMNAAWHSCQEEELPHSIGVNPDDARSFFEDGFRAALAWVKEQRS